VVNLSVILFGLGPLEIILILAVGVLLFGGRKFPELMRGIGQGVKEYKKASDLDEDKDKEADKKKKVTNN
jgi:sec-independent protein translocase protein TatA